MNANRFLSLVTLTVCLLNPAVSDTPLPSLPQQAAYTATADPQPTLRVCICADAARGVLYRADGTPVQELIFDRRGQVAAGPLYPGRYCVKASGLSLQFTVLHNASLTQAEGDGWTDGELLYLQAKEP